MGAWGASSAAGEVLVVFGADSHPAVVGASDLDGIGGFLIWGATTSDASGFSVSTAGVSEQRRSIVIIFFQKSFFLFRYSSKLPYTIPWETVHEKTQSIRTH